MLLTLLEQLINHMWKNDLFLIFKALHTGKDLTPPILWPNLCVYIISMGKFQHGADVAESDPILT